MWSGGDWEQTVFPRHTRVILASYWFTLLPNLTLDMHGTTYTLLEIITISNIQNLIVACISRGEGPTSKLAWRLWVIDNLEIVELEESVTQIMQGYPANWVGTREEDILHSLGVCHPTTCVLLWKNESRWANCDTSTREPRSSFRSNSRNRHKKRRAGPPICCDPRRAHCTRIASFRSDCFDRLDM